MENHHIHTYPSDEGMRLVLNMIKGKHLAMLANDKDSTALTWISQGAWHSIHNGKPSYYSKKQVDELQVAIDWTCYQLNGTWLEMEAQTQEVYPYCHGTDFVSKFKVLGKVIKLPYLFTDVLGKTEKWRKMHLSQKDSPYYNSFTEEEIEMINEGIKEVARRLGCIRLEWQEEGRR